MAGEMNLGRALQFLAAATAVALLSCAEARPGPLHTASRAGDEYEISKSYETSERSSDGSTGSSRGRDVILERVIALRDGGLELEYDLPRNATAEERARSWEFPVRVFRPSSGPLQVLNRVELETRLEAWLKAAKLTRAACGQWIFTWNAFRIECDPQSVAETIQAFDLRSTALQDGAPYREADARGPGTLARKAARPDGETFVAILHVDPAAERRRRAEVDVAVGEIMKKPVTLEAALRKRANEDVSGTITTTFDTDRSGEILRRTRVTKLKITTPDGESESRTVTETVERRLASAGRAPQ